VDKIFKYLSVFDLDGTITKYNSVYLFGNHLFKHRKISLQAYLKCVFYVMKFKRKKLTLVNFHRKVSSLFFSNYSMKTLVAEYKEFFHKQIEKNLYLPCIKAIKEAKKNNHFLLLLSSSPEFIVQNFSEYFSFNSYHGSQYEASKKDGSILLCKVMDVFEKKINLHNYQKKLEISYENIGVFSDSHLDLELFKQGKTAVAVNPDRHLKKYAKSKGWSII
jgi:phosphoserine phosphatase